TGTAKSLKDEALSIAGKTGTTKINYTNKEESPRYNASFCGYFPADNPVYSMIIVLYEPIGAFYGAAVAAPIFKKIAHKVVALDKHYASAIKNSPESENAQHLDSESKPKIIPTKSSGYAADYKGIFDFLNIPYKALGENNWVHVDPNESKMLIEDKSIKKGKVPDVYGMGARDAIYVLENLGLAVSVQGKGKVAKMSLHPGTPIKGQRIEIVLN
ncbi:MAG TPA: penicillin-binding transpeptidase domain-containing protein, partial [Saprospiraceae bacterium]|nr:penicillin-binding transpeptidase domain-containing protein [Saprospiraceae bacterium]